MDETVQGWTLYYGYKLYYDFGDGSNIGGGRDYCISGQFLGYLEDTNVIYVRHVDCGVEGFDVEVYYFCPMQDEYRDSFIVLVVLKNGTDSSQSLYVGVYNNNDKLTASLAYSTARNAVTSRDDGGKTWILGSPDPIDAVYMDDDWRSGDYTASATGSYSVRWRFTLNPGETKTWTIINAFGWSEDEALQLYNALKALDCQQLLEENVKFWRDWLNKGKQWSTGRYELDQLLRLSLCQLKASITPYQAMPSGIVAFAGSEWPSEIGLCYWALALWGHLDEAKEYFAVRIKKIVEYAIQNGLSLMKTLHITSLYGYTGGSGYSGAEYFELPIIAGEVYRLSGDRQYAADVWSWIKHIMDEIDTAIIDDPSSPFDGCFNWNHMTSEAVYESYWVNAPHNTRGTLCVSSVSPILVAYTYEQAAHIAEAVGEHEKASEYRAKAEKMRDKLRLFWNPAKRQYWHYWSDSEGFQEYYSNPGERGGNNCVPFRVLPLLCGYVNHEIREMLLLYHHNLIDMDGRKGGGSNILPTDADGNFMLGRVGPLGFPLNPSQPTSADYYFLSILGACVMAGLDDLVEHWLNLIADEYGRLDSNGNPRSFLFDIRCGWDATPWANYTMRRGMAFLLISMARLFTRPKPAAQRRFEGFLDRYGSDIPVLKPVEAGRDEFGNPIYDYEPRAVVKALVNRLRADEEVVKAGRFTTDDVKVLFKAFTPVSEGDRVVWGGSQYQIQTVQKRHVGTRIIMVEAYARRVVE